MKVIGISQARARLFDLVDKVLATDRIVWIAHRDRDSRVALVSEERLKRLEEEARADRRGPRPGFKLAGSIRLRKGEDVDLILEDIRKEAAERFQGKFADIDKE